MEFKCKQFALNHSSSTMKVGTDSILLASIVSEKLNTFPINNIIDVGTGCGILSLCMAQTFPNAEVLGIDIDLNSINEAEYNFNKNPFHNRMRTQYISFQDFSLETSAIFDLIISNPPFFTDSLKSPNGRRTLARHNYSLSINDFVHASKRIVNPKSFVAVILPNKEAQQLQQLFSEIIFYPFEIVDIYSKTNISPHRQIIIFTHYNNLIALDSSYSVSEVKSHKSLYIRDEKNAYTDEYLNLCSQFLL